MREALVIDSIETPGGGRIGMVHCPGRPDFDTGGALLQRNLDADLADIARWGAVALVSLIETHEFELIGVGGLGERVLAQGLEWHHLPIVDLGVPDDCFELSWRQSGPRLRGLLQDGRDIVLHCAAGKGRTGTIAARLLIEFGVEPDAAIRAVRSARLGTIESIVQEQFLRGYLPYALD